MEAFRLGKSRTEWRKSGLAEIAGLDNDGRIRAIDCNQLKITIERFYQLTRSHVRITVLKASYVLRRMKFTLISKNYERAMSIT